MKRTAPIAPIAPIAASKTEPVPSVRPRNTAMRARHLGPLIAFIVPTVAIGYGVVIPDSCIAGVNSLTVGFATTLLGASITYLLGVRVGLRARLE